MQVKTFGDFIFEYEKIQHGEWKFTWYLKDNPSRKNYDTVSFNNFDENSPIFIMWSYITQLHIVFCKPSIYYVIAGCDVGHGSHSILYFQYVNYKRLYTHTLHNGTTVDKYLKF